MKKLNNKGFAVSTLIYGILILFIVVISILISTLSFRYRSLSDITTRAEDKKGEYFLNVGIYLENNEEYTTPHSATYNFEYNVGEERKICSVHLENNKTIKYDNNEYKLYIDETEIDNCDFTNNESIYLKNIKTTERLIEDRSGANIPDLRNGLVPVKYVDNKWIITSPDDPEWYNYDKQKWANAVILKNKDKGVGHYIEVDIDKTTNGNTESELDIYAMFVWIPRYSYTIGCVDFDGNGSINTETKSDLSTVSECLGYKIEKASNLGKVKEAKTIIPGAIDIKFVAKDKKDELKYEDEEKEKPIYPTYEYSVDSSGMPMADRDPKNWYTHPAFTFGDEELSGIWVGKFETSVNLSSDCYTALVNKSGVSSKCKYNYKNTNQEEDVTPRILPNVLSLVYQDVYNQFETAKKFTSNTIYGLTTNTDSHMMKNSEWGAVAYLSQSIYGKYGNANYEGANKEIYKNDSGTTDYWSRYTGRSYGNPLTKFDENNKQDINREKGTYKYNDIKINEDGTDGEKEDYKGTGASTTGNIYGIYDMSGGAYEHVMGYYAKDSSVFGGYTSGDTELNSSGFTDKTKPESKYFDEYTTNISSRKNNESIGHATYETNSWYGDINFDINKGSPFVIRGGYAGNSSELAGIFRSVVSAGQSHYHYSFRTVLLN